MFTKSGAVYRPGSLYRLIHASGQNSGALIALLHAVSRPSPLLDIRWLPS